MISYDMNLYNFGDPVNHRLVELVRAVNITADSDWHIAMHQHEYYCEWEYVEAGRGTYIIDSRTYQVQAGDLTFINCGTSHEAVSDPADPLVSWKVTCRLSPQGSLGANIILPDGYEPLIHAGAAAPALTDVCHRLFGEMEKKEPGYKTMAALLTEEYYILASRLIEPLGTKLMPAKRERHDDLALQAKKYINQHYAEKITLEILAKELHASKFYISHEMQKEYGCSPIDYLISRRMGEAHNLLNTTDISIREISRMVGYDNTSYFNVLFARRTGVTPTEFRARNQRSNSAAKNSD